MPLNRVSLKAEPRKDAAYLRLLPLDVVLVEGRGKSLILLHFGSHLVRTFLRMIYQVVHSLNPVVDFAELHIVVAKADLKLLLSKKGLVFVIQISFSLGPVLLQKVLNPLSSLVFVSIGSRIHELLVEQRCVHWMRFVALGHVLREKICALPLGRSNFWVTAVGNDLLSICSKVVTWLPATFHFFRLQIIHGLLLVGRQKRGRLFCLVIVEDFLRVCELHLALAYLIFVGKVAFVLLQIHYFNY